MNNRTRKIILTLLALLVIIPNIVSVGVLINQAKMQRQIDNIAAEVASMRMDSLGKMSRIISPRLDGTRLVDLGIYFDTEDRIYADEDVIMVADIPDVAEMQEDGYVWSFSSSGSLDTHKVYLTFDDGPSASTDEILDILDEYGVKATFFVIGRESEEDNRLYNRIVSEGHTLGMHSYSHKYSKLYSSEEAFSEDLDRLTELLEDVTGVTPKFYRFPGGSSNTVSSLDIHRFIDILDARGISYFDWNVSVGDATGIPISADAIVNNALSGIEERDTTVILMHDGQYKRATVEALPRIIEALQAMEDVEILPITSETELIRHID
ncbi:MAG: polysaccharide deacetylase [Lachnospiraceae bacterium]|nr:polysaccharide deacetylase [Lachnospiraceae bacterium]